jgi:hypothetical protein
MRDRVRYRPSGDWALEERAALSHTAAHVGVLAGLHATVRGQVTTVIQQGIDIRSEQAKLRGSARAPGIGPIRLAGVLHSGFVDVISSPDRGTLTVTAAKHPGSVRLDLTGLSFELAPVTPTTTRLSFTVAKATGRWARSLGTQGTAELTLVTPDPSPLNRSLMSTSRGTFALVLTRAWGPSSIGPETSPKPSSLLDSRRAGSHHFRSNSSWMWRSVKLR